MSVWHAVRLSTDTPAALKQLRLPASPAASVIASDCELHFLATAYDTNIIRLLDVIQTQDRLYLVMELCEGGDLACYIDRTGRVEERVARNFKRQIGN